MATKITGMTAASGANIDDTALFEMVDKLGATVKATIAQVRTAVLTAGVITYAMLSAGAVSGVLAGNAATATTAGTVTGAAQAAITSVGTLTSLTVSGLTASAGLTITTSAFAAGTLYKTAANGLVVAGVTGSANDFAIVTPLGAGIMTVPTGTQNVAFNGQIAPASLFITNASLQNIITLAGATTGPQYLTWQNTGAQGLLGIDNSAGNGLVTGGSAYSAVFGTQNNTSAIIATNGATRMTITGAGAATLTGALAIGGALTGVTTLATSSTINSQTISATASLTGSLQVATGFGCNTKTPQTAVVSGGALASYVTGAFGLDSTAHMQALFNLVVNIRTALVANGIMS